MVVLLATNYLSFESSWLSESSSQDKAIIQSFVVFIAFERALTLLKDLEFKPSDFLKILIYSFLKEWYNTSIIDKPKRYNSDEYNENSNQINKLEEN